MSLKKLPSQVSITEQVPVQLQNVTKLHKIFPLGNLSKEIFYNGQKLSRPFVYDLSYRIHHNTVISMIQLKRRKDGSPRDFTLRDRVSSHIFHEHKLYEKTTRVRFIKYLYVYFVF